MREKYLFFILIISFVVLLRTSSLLQKTMEEKHAEEINRQVLLLANNQQNDYARISKLEKEVAFLQMSLNTTSMGTLGKKRLIGVADKSQTLETAMIPVHLITPPSAAFEAEEKTENCVRLSTQAMDHAKFRIVVYQKQGGQQLIDLIVHYLQALTYDEIVVLANEDGDILKTTPMYKELISCWMLQFIQHSLFIENNI